MQTTATELGWALASFGIFGLPGALILDFGWDLGMTRRPLIQQIVDRLIPKLSSHPDSDF
jgi:hypothetical protein